MKSNLFLEFQGKQISEKQLVQAAKDIWVNQGNKVKDLATLELYYKPEEKSCYYVMNENLKGNFDV